MKYYRIKWGYGKDDFYSVNEQDVPRAIKAQLTGSVFMCDEGTIAGNSIMAIMPDYNRILGFNRDYQLTGEDYAELTRETKHEHMQYLEDIKHQIENKQLMLES